MSSRGCVHWPPDITIRTGTFAHAEVSALEHVAQAFRGWRCAGSGLSRTAVIGQLTDLTDRLRTAPEHPLTDRALLVAAELSKITATMAAEAGDTRTTQRYYILATQLATTAAHTSYAAVILAALARTSYDLGATGDGLDVIHLAQRGTATAAPPGLRAMLATREAWAHAQRGDTPAFQHAVAAAEDAFTDHVPDDEPAWLGGFDAAELSGVIGARYRDLARHHRDQADHAITYINRALALRPATRPRNRAFDLIGLARTHLITGDPDHSSILISQATPLIDRQRPGRLGRKLGDWHREAAPYATVAAVRDTRAEIRDLIRT